jgi:hypothetical protein
VPTKNYSHIILGDEVMAVEIVVESMEMMKAKKSLYQSDEGDQSTPKALVFSW